MATSEWSDEFFIELPGRGDVGWDDAYRIAQRTWEVNIAPALKGNHVLSGVSPIISGSGATLAWTAGTVFLDGRPFTVESGETTFTENQDIIWITAVPLSTSAAETGATIDVREGEHYPPSSVSGWYTPIAIAKTEAGNITRMKDIRNVGPLNASKSQPYRVNLLTNRKFGSWPDSTGPHKISGVSATSVSAGVVILAATPSFTIEKGQLLTFGGSGSGPTNTGVSVYEIDSVTGQTQFTLSSTGVYTGVTDIYLALPGGSGSAGVPATWSNAYGTGYGYRMQSGEGVKDGSLYSAQFVKTVATDQAWVWPSNWDDKANYSRFAGRTVTLGSWVKCYRADSFYWTLNSGAGGMSGVTSEPHSGNGEWEWIEKTYDVPSDATSFYVRPEFMGPSGTSFYVAPPVLVYGHAIGEGNYVQDEETVWGKQVTLDGYNSVTVSADATINLETETKGAVPKGAKAVYMRLQGACATVPRYIGLRGLETVTGPVVQYSQVSGVLIFIMGWVPCDANGNISLFRNDTFTSVHIQVIGVRY